MKPKSMKDLRTAIERNEVLYLTLDNYDLKKQVWQTLVYLRGLLKNKRNS